MSGRSCGVCRGVQVLPRPKVDFRTPTNQGYIETTYVDEEVRVGRSPGGSVFVFVREKKL
jgi:hypothetical protein